MLTTTKKLTPAEAARKFVDKCREWGWDYVVTEGRATVTKRFIPGDKAAYTICDSEGYDLLAICPLKGGSVWGTDGGSIGGYTGLQNGRYTLNKSGESGKRFCAEVRKIS